MKPAIISDVHSNLEALEAVLRDIDKEKADRIISLGDIVGYGANPNEVITLFKKYNKNVDVGGRRIFSANHN